MNYKYYQKKINDIITKCPIEAGVEILVYNLLDECIDCESFSLVDVNRIEKNKDKRLVTDGGVPDIAVLSPDFMFSKINKGKVYGFIEVKKTSISLRETKRIVNEKGKCNHFIYTNGIEWKYYEKGMKVWTINLTKPGLVYSVEPITVVAYRFEMLKTKLKQVQWDKLNAKGERK